MFSDSRPRMAPSSAWEALVSPWSSEKRVAALVVASATMMAMGTSTSDFR